MGTQQDEDLTGDEKNGGGCEVGMGELVTHSNLVCSLPQYLCPQINSPPRGPYRLQLLTRPTYIIFSSSLASAKRGHRQSALDIPTSLWDISVSWMLQEPFLKRLFEMTSDMTLIKHSSQLGHLLNVLITEPQMVSAECLTVLNISCSCTQLVFPFDILLK